MIAIIGATGYIGRSIARVLIANGADSIALYARDTHALAGMGWPSHVRIKPLADFNAEPFDLVINAIGAGDPARVSAMGASILDVTQVWDQRVLDTLTPATRYVFLSSGAVYGKTFDRPPNASGTQVIMANPADSLPPYVEGKLAAEARHRATPDRSILDLRVFAFADESISLDGTSFLADLARSVATGQILVTSPDDMLRDYAGALELSALIRCWLTAGAPNGPLDLYTRSPVSKQALIELATSRYHIAVRYCDYVQASPTGRKPSYASTSRAAEALGYAPSRNSMEVVMAMLDAVARSAK